MISQVFELIIDDEDDIEMNIEMNEENNPNNWNQRGGLSSSGKKNK